MALQLLQNQLVIMLLFIAIGIPVSVAARFFELKGLQVWLPFSVIVAIGAGPIEGIAVAAAIMLVSFAIKPYPAHTLAIMLAILALMLYALQLFQITRANFLFTAMLATIIYLAVIDVMLAFVHPDVKTAVLWLAFSIPISFVIYSQIGWQAIMLLRSATPLF